MHASIRRRTFLKTGLRYAGGAALLGLPACAVPHNPGSYRVQDIIDLILKKIPGPPILETVDTLKSGKPDQEVKAIVTTMFPTVPVIRKAASLGANFIIAHEPTFYNHADDLNWVSGNKIVQEKMNLLQQNGMAVWRFHDHWHAYRPDGIFYGFLQATGWNAYLKPDSRLVHIPPDSLSAIITHLKKTLDISTVRVIGDLQQTCQKIAILPGAAGGQKQVNWVEKENPDLLIVGEVQEWETAEYFRDSIALGHQRALVVLGHALSEEPGMNWLVDWLKPMVPGLPVTHIPSGSPFAFV